MWELGVGLCVWPETVTRAMQKVNVFELIT